MDTVREYLLTFMISRWILLRMRNVLDKVCRENQNTLFMFDNFFFYFEIVPFVRQCGKNTVQPDRPMMTVRHMRIAWWIPKATNTHTHTLSLSQNKYVMLIAIPMQQWLHERTSTLRYIYTDSLVNHL